MLFDFVMIRFQFAGFLKRLILFCCFLSLSACSEAQEDDRCSMESCEVENYCYAAKGSYQDLERECYQLSKLVACGDVNLHFNELAVTVVDPDGGCWEFYDPVWPKDWTLVDGSFETDCTPHAYWHFPMCPEAKVVWDEIQRKLYEETMKGYK